MSSPQKELIHSSGNIQISRKTSKGLNDKTQTQENPPTKTKKPDKKSTQTKKKAKKQK